MKATRTMRRVGLTGVAALALMAACSALAAAPEAAGLAAAAGEAPGMSWREIVRSGGSLMYVLGAMSVLALALVIYLFYVLRLAQVAPRALQREVIQKLRAGEAEQARRACEYRPCPLAVVAMAAIDYSQNVPGAAPAMLRDVLEGEGSRQAEAIQGQTQYLLDIGTIAPMVGLLGTVFGLLQAFSGVAMDMTKARPVVLADGVSKALITTAAGLVIGIPAMAFYAYFRRRAAQLVACLESGAAELLTALLGTRGESGAIDDLR